MPGTSSTCGSPDGSGPDLDGMGHRSIDAQFKELRDILLPLARGFADFDNHFKTISDAVGAVTSRITSVEQTVNALVAKMALLAAKNGVEGHGKQETTLAGQPCLTPLTKRNCPLVFPANCT